MGALADNDVGLLILDLGEQLGQLLDLDLQRILWAVGFRDIDDTVDVEGDLLAVGTPVLITEAVGVLAVVLGLEGEIAVGDGLFVYFVLGNWVGDLVCVSNGLSLPRQRVVYAYPEVNVEVASTAKLAVANLERHGHLIIAVQVLVEALSAMCR